MDESIKHSVVRYRSFISFEILAFLLIFSHKVEKRAVKDPAVKQFHLCRHLCSVKWLFSFLLSYSANYPMRYSYLIRN